MRRSHYGRLERCHQDIEQSLQGLPALHPILRQIRAGERWWRLHSFILLVYIKFFFSTIDPSSCPCSSRIELQTRGHGWCGWTRSYADHQRQMWWCSRWKLQRSCKQLFIYRAMAWSNGFPSRILRRISISKQARNSLPLRSPLMEGMSSKQLACIMGGKKDWHTYASALCTLLQEPWFRILTYMHM